MGKRVLLLDDDDDLLASMSDLIRLAFSRDVLKVHSFDELREHGDEALACDLAILDINLGPGEPSGLDALGWLRDRGFAAPVVFLTGHARTHPLVAQAQESGEAEVLEKPITSRNLGEVLEAPAE